MRERDSRVVVDLAGVSVCVCVCVRARVCVAYTYTYMLEPFVVDLKRNVHRTIVRVCTDHLPLLPVQIKTI